MAYSHYNTKATKSTSAKDQAAKATRKEAIAKATKDDTFRTPLHVFADLVNQHKYLFKKRMDVFDPSAGDGRYTSYLIKRGIVGNFRLNDLHKFEKKAWAKDKRLGGVKKTVKDFFRLKLKKKYDMVITNPPFKFSERFVDKMLKHCKPGGLVIIFEKHSFNTGQKRREWLKTVPLKYQIVISYRVAFDIDGVDKSDAATYNHAWWVFEKGFKGEAVVRYIERDEKMVELYGKKTGKYKR